MDVISVVFATVSAVISILSLLASTFNATKNRKFQKELEKFKADSDKEIVQIKYRYEQELYKNKVLFDSKTSRCEELTQSMFKNYNNALLLFPMVETFSSESELVENHKLASEDFNVLVKLIATSKVILPQDILDMLDTFEKTMREILFGFLRKIIDQTKQNEHLKIIKI